MYKSEWTRPPTSKLNKQQEEYLEEEVRRISNDLDRASDLIFHTVFLTEDTNGTSVMISGRDGVDDTLFLTYYETTEWVTLEDLDDER